MACDTNKQITSNFLILFINYNKRIFISLLGHIGNFPIQWTFLAFIANGQIEHLVVLSTSFSPSNNYITSVMPLFLVLRNTKMYVWVITQVTEQAIDIARASYDFKLFYKL